MDELVPLERAECRTSERALVAFLVLYAEVNALLVFPQVANVVRGIVAELARVQHVIELHLQVDPLEVVRDGALRRGREVAAAALKDLEFEVDGVDVIVDRPLALGAVVALGAREVANVAVNVSHVRFQNRLV